MKLLNHVEHIAHRLFSLTIIVAGITVVANIIRIVIVIIKTIITG